MAKTRKNEATGEAQQQIRSLGGAPSMLPPVVRGGTESTNAGEAGARPMEPMWNCKAKDS